METKEVSETYIRLIKDMYEGALIGVCTGGRIILSSAGRFAPRVCTEP